MRLLTMTLLIVLLPWSASSRDRPAPCISFRPFIFIKTHKTGGSTVATLLHGLSLPASASDLDKDSFLAECCPQFVPPSGMDAHKWNFSIPQDRFLALNQANRIRHAYNRRCTQAAPFNEQRREEGMHGIVVVDLWLLSRQFALRLDEPRGLRPFHPLADPAAGSAGRLDRQASREEVALRVGLLPGAFQKGVATVRRKR
jgi:hypothetical protein